MAKQVVRYYTSFEEARADELADILAQSMEERIATVELLRLEYCRLHGVTPPRMERLLERAVAPSSEVLVDRGTRRRSARVPTVHGGLRRVRRTVRSKRKEALIENKRAANRAKDLGDIAALEEITRAASRSRSKRRRPAAKRSRTPGTHRR